MAEPAKAPKTGTKKPDARKTKGKPRTKGQSTDRRTEKQRKRDAEAYQYRLMGHSFPEIAEALECALSTAFKSVERGRNDLLVEPTETLVQMQIERCNILIASNMNNASVGDERAAATILATMKQIDSYHGIGLSKPRETSSSVTLPDGTEYKTRTLSDFYTADA